MCLYKNIHTEITKNLNNQLKSHNSKNAEKQCLDYSFQA